MIKKKLMLKMYCGPICFTYTFWDIGENGIRGYVAFDVIGAIFINIVIFGVLISFVLKFLPTVIWLKVYKKRKKTLL